MADLLDDADIDFDRAASAFPDISLDGDGDIPTFATPPSHTPPPAGPFDLDAFGGPTPAREVRVTGHDADDEIGKFESEFPELDVPQVTTRNLCPHAVSKVNKADDDNSRQSTYPPPNPRLVPSPPSRHAPSNRLSQQLQF